MDRGGRRRARRGHGARAERVPVEPRVLLHARRRWPRNEAPRDRAFRIGGLVEAGSVVREKDALTVRFRVTDTAKTIPGRLHRHPSRPLPRGQGRGRAGPASAPTASFQRERGARQARRELHAAGGRRGAEKAGHPIDKSAFAGQKGRKHDSRARPLRPRHRARARARRRRVLAFAGAAIERRARCIATARPIAIGQFLFVARRLRRARHAFVGKRLLACVNVATQLQLEAADAPTASPRPGARTRARCCSGRSMLAGWTLRGRALQPPPAASACVARVLGVMGARERRVPALHAAHVESVRAPAARGRRTAAT